MRRVDDSEPTADRPIDLAALRADDTLIDDLAAGRFRAPDLGADPSPDDELRALLAAWVDEVRPGALAAASTSTTAAPVTASAGRAAPADESASDADADADGRIPARRTGSALRLGRRIGVAAAIVAVGTLGLSVQSAAAMPGETMWIVSKVLHADRARSVEAAVVVTTGLEQARTQLRLGHQAEARRMMATVRAQLEIVRPDEGHDALAREHQILIRALADPSLVAPAGVASAIPPPDDDVVMAAPDPRSPDPRSPDPGSPDLGSPDPTPRNPGAAPVPAPRKATKQPIERRRAEPAPAGPAVSSGPVAAGAILPTAPLPGAEDVAQDLATGRPDPSPRIYVALPGPDPITATTPSGAPRPSRSPTPTGGPEPTPAATPAAPTPPTARTPPSATTEPIPTGAPEPTGQPGILIDPAGSAPPGPTIPTADPGPDVPDVASAVATALDRGPR